MQGESFTGLLVPFLGSAIEGTLKDFSLLDDALEETVEQKNTQPSPSQRPRTALFDNAGTGISGHV